jgi:hypothetical protein
VSHDLLDKLQKYQPNSPECENFDRPHVKKTQMGLVYNLFRTLGADHEINPNELNIIYRMAEKLGVTKDKVQEIHDLYNEEEKLRRKRAALLFPHGFKDAQIEYQKYIKKM